MKTKLIKDDIKLAAEILRSGGLVAVPTETVYGLAGNGLDEKAVSSIYEVKGRPAVKPLSLMVPGKDSMELYCDDVPEQAKKLAEKFWPGPLTIVLKSKMLVPDIVRAGGETVGLRCPQHSLTLEALRLAGVPFAAPSANPSGSESPKDAQTVLDYFDGKIDAVIDGGSCNIGLESTLIDMSRKPFRILREGALSGETVADALAEELKLIGITGGSGSGKTTALRVLEDMGAKVVDCDKVYHELLHSDSALLAELESAFPEAFSAGQLDRKALGAIVFKDNFARLTLNDISHRHIIIKLRMLFRKYAMEGAAVVAIDAIELISSGLSKECSATIAVVADSERRINRIMERDNIGRDYALMRLKAQPEDDYYEKNCDYTLRNDSTTEAFEAECRKLFKEIV